VRLRKQVDRDGFAAYMQFLTVFILETDMRQDESDPHVAAFADFKNKVRDGMVTQDDIDWLRDRCSINAMKARDPNEWSNRGFDGDDAIHLYPTNKDVRKRNHDLLQNLGKSIALVEAEHSSPMAKKFSPSQANNLETKAYFAIGAKVLLTSNIQQSIGLCNGAVGTIKDMIWYDGRQPPTVPDAIIVDFGDDYTGDRVFQGEGREKWVPITPMLAHFQAKDEGEHWRKMVPLRLSWAWTIHKAQGQTITHPIVLDLGDSEKELGLAYTAFTRAKTIGQIGLKKGINSNRLMKSIAEHKSLPARLQEEKRLRSLANSTLSQI
jgi:hypothetical protein